MLTMEVFSQPLRVIFASLRRSSCGSHSDNSFRYSGVLMADAMMWAIEVLICGDGSVRSGR